MPALRASAPSLVGSILPAICFVLRCSVYPAPYSPKLPRAGAPRICTVSTPPRLTSTPHIKGNFTPLRTLPLRITPLNIRRSSPVPALRASAPFSRPLRLVSAPFCIRPLRAPLCFIPLHFHSIWSPFHSDPLFLHPKSSISVPLRSVSSPFLFTTILYRHYTTAPSPKNALNYYPPLRTQSFIQ